MLLSASGDCARRSGIGIGAGEVGERLDQDWAGLATNLSGCSLGSLCTSAAGHRVYSTLR